MCAGHVMINGIERPLKEFKSLVGFVPQEDIMIRNLTVEENLRFCAFSRLPSSWSDAKKVAVDAYQS
jgi:ABC-type multidrug transport system ATPase subunit